MCVCVYRVVLCFETMDVQPAVSAAAEEPVGVLAVTDVLYLVMCGTCRREQKCIRSFGA